MKCESKDILIAVDEQQLRESGQSVKEAINCFDEVDCSGVDFSYENLSALNLEKIKFCRGTFNYTNLCGAKLKEVDFTEADITNCFGLLVSELFKAKTDGLSITKEDVFFNAEKLIEIKKAKSYWDSIKDTSTEQQRLLFDNMLLQVSQGFLSKDCNNYKKYEENLGNGKKKYQEEKQIFPKQGKYESGPLAQEILFQAAKSGDLERVKECLESACFVNGTDVHQRTALHWACLGGQLAVLSYLIEKAANLNAADENRNTPLHLVLLQETIPPKEKVDLVALLLKHRASTELANENQEKAVMLALKENDPDILKEFLVYEKDPQLSQLWQLITHSDNAMDRTLEICCKQYDTSTREATTVTHTMLSQRVCEWLSIEEIKYDFFHYLALQENRAGLITDCPNMLKEEPIKINGRSLTVAIPLRDKIPGFILEGWNPRGFLAARLRFFLEIYIQLKKGLLTGAGNELLEKEDIKAVLIEKLYREIVCGIEAFRAVAIRESLQSAKVNELFIPRFKQEHLKRLCQCIASLQDGQEWYYPTGLDTHAIYVSFIRHQDKIIIRAENQGEGYETLHLHQIDPVSDKVKIQPRQIAVVPHSSFSNSARPCLEYLENLMEAPIQQEKLALEKIYNYPFKVSTENYAQHWPHKNKQAVGNCVVKNHNVGLACRFFVDKESHYKSKGNHELYKWLRKTEAQCLQDNKKLSK